MYIRETRDVIMIRLNKLFKPNPFKNDIGALISNPPVYQHFNGEMIKAN